MKRRRWTLPMLVCLSVLTSIAYSQPADRPAEKPERNELKIFNLRNSDAHETSRLLSSLFTKEMRIAVDPRTNSIIVSGDPEQLRTAEAVLMHLDQAAADSKETAPRARSFSLEHVSPNDVARQLEAKDPKMTLQVQNKMLSVIARPDVLEEVEKLVAKLDQPPPAPRTMRVRVIWLLASNEDRRIDALAMPPEDLKPVLDELAGLGIKEVRLATQMVVYGTAGNQPLQINGRLDEPLQSTVDVQGELLEKASATPSLRLQIRVSGDSWGGRGASGSRGVSTSLSTQISTPPGHFVVLGATPIEAFTSVFVVQVTPKSQGGDAKSAADTPDDTSPLKTAPKPRR